MTLSKSRLRLTEAKFFGNSQTAGNLTSLSQGTGIALTPNPITATGVIAIATPVANVNGGTGANTSATGGAGQYVKQVGVGSAFTVGALVPGDLNAVVPYSKGGTNASTAWTPGSVIFAGATTFAQDNSNLFWDNTNKRLGIGTATPRFDLDVPGKTVLSNGTWMSLAATFAAVADTARPTTHGLEAVLGASGAGVTTNSEASVAWFQKILAEDIYGNPHTVQISSIKQAGTLADNFGARSGSLNIVSIDQVGWNSTTGTGAEAFVEGIHIKSIGSWVNSLTAHPNQGSVQGITVEAAVNELGSEYGFINTIESNVYNLRAAPPSGNKTWATLNGSWPGNMIINIMANNTATNAVFFPIPTYATDVGFCVGNAWGSGQMYTGFLCRDDAIATDGHPIMTKGFTETKTGMVGVGTGLLGADATADLSVVRTNGTNLNGLEVILGVSRKSTGTTANGFGSITASYLQAADGTQATAATDVVNWGDITNKRAVRHFYTWSGNASGYEAFQIANNGSVPLVGFFGAGAVAQPASMTGKTVADVITALQNLGLFG